MKTKNLFKRTLLFAGGLALFLLLAAAALVIYVVVDEPKSGNGQKHGI